MKTTVPNTKLQKAFTYVELVLVISVIGIVSAMGLTTVGKFRPAVETAKFQSDVVHLNSAIKIYKSSGGDLDGLTDPDLVIAKLKTHRDETDAKTYVGFTGSTVDRRLATRHVGAAYKGARVVYDKDAQKFKTTSAAVDGFLFTLADDATAPQGETREHAAVKYASNSTWVWDYEDTGAAPRIEPTLIAKTLDPASPIETPIMPPTPSPVPEPELKKLLPPVFSLDGDYYPLGGYPLAVTLSDPNDAGQGKIVYGIVSQSDWEWTDYTGPILVGPEDQIVAYVESFSPQENHHSNPVNERYDWTTELGAPVISVSEPEIEARTGSVTVSIDSGIVEGVLSWGDRQLSVPPGSYEVRYKLIPTVPGEGTATSWSRYTGPIDIGGPQFPRGFEVLAKVVSLSPNFSDSPESARTVSTFYRLDSPVIESSREFLSTEGESAMITLTNPNPNDSSELVYRLFDDNGSPRSGWLEYAGPFEVSGDDFPTGFSVKAKAIPMETYYRESDESLKIIDVRFFGIELTGRTIFVLDSSGSMQNYDRIARLKTAAKQALNAFGSDEYFAMIDYDTLPRVIASWGKGTAARKSSAVARIDRMAAGGSTNYHAALEAALGLNAGGATQVIFLSDGLPWNTTLENPSSTDGILELVDALLASGITQVDTVAIGTPRRILRDMAARGNGTSVSVPD